MNSTVAPCRACGQPVSEFAPRCPHCGDPTAQRFGHAEKKSTNPWMIIGWIILALLLLPLVTCIAVIGGMGMNSGSTDSTWEAPSQEPPQIAPVETLYRGYLAAKEAGHAPTAEGYAETIRRHYPDSPERQKLDPK